MTNDPSFFIVRGTEPWSCLWRAFPELRSFLNDSEAGDYEICGHFAELLVVHRDDEGLWHRVYAFMDSLASTT